MDALDYIGDHFPTHLTRLQNFIRQPTISATGEGIHEGVAHLAALLHEAGFSVSIEQTAGNPILDAQIGPQGTDALLVYGMYDVQPADEGEWCVDPFGGDVVEDAALGPCLVGRGSFNSKGPLIGFLNSVEAMAATGELRTRVHLVIEGEEEQGSPHLERYLQTFSSRYQQCRGAIFPDFCEKPCGTPLFWAGVKGLVKLELAASGGRWGGPRGSDVHSRYAACIGSPVWRLVSALSTIVGRNEEILIRDFAADITPVTAWEREQIAGIAADLGMDLLLEEARAERAKRDGPAADVWEHYIRDPTVNIAGLEAGYTGKGFRTVLPHTARARMDVRLVPEMTPETTYIRIRQHLDALGFADVEMQMLAAYPPAQTHHEARVVVAAERAARACGRPPKILPRLPGSLPMHLFTDLLGISLIGAGLGHGGRHHSANEYATLDGLRRFEEFVVRFLKEWAVTPMRIPC